MALKLHPTLKTVIGIRKLPAPQHLVPARQLLLAPERAVPAWQFRHLPAHLAAHCARQEETAYRHLPAHLEVLLA